MCAQRALIPHHLLTYVCPKDCEFVLAVYIDGSKLITPTLRKKQFFLETAKKRFRFFFTATVICGVYAIVLPRTVKADL